MAYRMLAANDISARQVDAGIKNKFEQVLVGRE